MSEDSTELQGLITLAALDTLSDHSFAFADGDLGTDESTSCWKMCL